MVKKLDKILVEKDLEAKVIQIFKEKDDFCEQPSTYTSGCVGDGCDCYACNHGCYVSDC